MAFHHCIEQIVAISWLVATGRKPGYWRAGNRLSQDTGFGNYNVRRFKISCTAEDLISTAILTWRHIAQPFFIQGCVRAALMADGQSPLPVFAFFPFCAPNPAQKSSFFGGPNLSVRSCAYQQCHVTYESEQTDPPDSAECYVRT